MCDDRLLQTYLRETPHADYRGLPGPLDTAGEREIRAEAERALGRLAERYGLRPEAAVARHDQQAVSLGLGRDYRAQELAERAETRIARGERTESLAEANAAITRFHREVAHIHREAREHMREVGHARDAPEQDRSQDDRTEAFKRILTEIERKTTEARGRGDYGPEPSEDRGRER